MLTGNVVKQVLELFSELETHIEKFKSSSGAHCISNCGYCCNKEDIEDTVLSFIPLAVELWRTNEAMLWYEYLENNPDKKNVYFS